MHKICLKPATVPAKNEVVAPVGKSNRVNLFEQGKTVKALVARGIIVNIDSQRNAKYVLK